LAFLIQGSITDAQSADDVNAQKATVYIVRTSGLGSAINFKYFVDDTYIGKCKNSKYIKLELDPREYLIWAKSENRSFLEAEVEAGKTYVINAIPKMGGFKAAVNLLPINNYDEKELQKAKKILTKKEMLVTSEDELEKKQQELSQLISDGLNKYETELKGTDKVARLTEPTEL